MKFNKNQTLGFTSKLSDFEIINSEFTRCKCYMLAVGDNVNGSDITLDSVKKAMSRGEFYNKPIVAHLYKDEDTGKWRVGGHDSKWVITNTSIEMINECIPFGTIPESSNLQLEEVLEPDGETTNTYLTCQIILWTGRFNIMDAAYNDSIYFNQSCELSINDYHWKENDILAIDDFTFSALCLLNKSDDKSKNVRPCFPSCRVEKMQEYSINADNIGKVSSIQYTSDVKLKDGVSLSTLKANQAIVSSSFAESLGSNTDAIMKAINDGAKIKYTYYSTENVAFELEIVGLYDNYYGLYVTDEFYQDLHSNSFDYVLTRAKGTSSDKHLVSYIENYKKDNVVYSIQFASTAMFDNFSSMITSMTKPFLYVGIGLAVFAGFMLMNFIATSISYKKREIGVLRAIGARGKDVFFMFFWESFVICIINFILASIGCGIACYFINKSLLVNLGFNITLLTFGVRQLLLMFAVSFGVAFISSFIPVYKIAHKNPIDSINNR